MLITMIVGKWAQVQKERINLALALVGLSTKIAKKC